MKKEGGEEMFCRFCGSKIPEGGRFCAACGKSVLSEETEFSRTQSGQSQGISGTYPMKWFKFVIYVQLFLNIVVLLINAVRCTTGLLYCDDVYMVYLIFRGLKLVDTAYGVVCLILAVAALIVRQKLAHYKAKAPAMYIGYFIVTLMAGLLYTLASLVVISGVSQGMLSSSIAEYAPEMVGQMVGAVVFVPLNYIYFKKRKELFVN